MSNYICCKNFNYENLIKCKNCGIENWHYFGGKWPNVDKTILICCFCRIETINDKTKEFREAYHLCEKKAPEPKQIKLL